jgi:hypothetical protein
LEYAGNPDPHNPNWQPWNSGELDGRGSEKGIIVRDECHYPLGLRITLERDTPTAPFAITCGIADWLVHTRFLSTSEEANEAYEEMKTELVRIAGLIPDTGDADLENKLDSLDEEMHDFIIRFQ